MRAVLLFALIALVSSLEASPRKHTIVPHVLTLNTPVPIFPPLDTTNVSDSVTFRWSSVAVATSYQYQMAATSQFRKFIVDTVVAGTSYFNTAIDPNRIYYWRVKARNGTDTSSWSPVFYFTTVLPKPGIPVLVGPTDKRDSVATPVILRWTHGLYSDSSRIWITKDRTLSTRMLDTTVSTDSLIVDLPYEGEEYFWGVIGINEQGEGPQSLVWSFTAAGVKSGMVEGGRIPRATLDVFPNPFRGSTEIQLGNGDWEGQLTDVSGRVLRTLSGAGGRPTQASGEGLRAGVYFLRIASRGSVVTRILTKLD